MADLRPMELAALGRPFSLGMLYDARSDMLISGMTLWDPQQLDNNIKEKMIPHTQLDIITEDSLQEKSKALGVEGSMKLSLLGGLIDASGSAKYADDSIKTSHVTRVILKYHKITKFEQLTMNHLGKGKLDHLDLFDLNIATHVVTGITYGADAFFVFDRTLSKEQNKEEAHGELTAVIKKFNIDGKAKLDLKQNEQNFVDKLNCKFYGDYSLEANPRSFEDAIKIYIDLPKLLGDKQQYAVPKIVHLYPLHLLDSKAAKIVRDISSYTVDYCVTFFQNLQQLEIRLLDLQKSKMFDYFKYMKYQLSDFAARLSELERVLKKKMVELLPKIRGVGSEETNLLQLFKTIDSSPFNKRQLESWIEEKEKEVLMMEQFIENLEENTPSNITIGTSSLSTMICNVKYHYILCLSFRFIDQDDQQLIDMKNDLQHEIIPKDQKNSLSRVQNQDILIETRPLLQQFIEFAGANRIGSTIAFVVNEEYPKDGAKHTQLVLYEGGKKKEGFKVPSKPDAPYASNITDCSITLKWDDEQAGSEQIQKYKIMYQEHKAESSSNTWNHVETNGNTKTICISNLPSCVPFVFKVQSMTKIGFSSISPNSQVIQTLGKLFIFHIR